jgi:hypothetical protein
MLPRRSPLLSFLFDSPWDSYSPVGIRPPISTGDPVPFAPMGIVLPATNRITGRPAVWMDGYWVGKAKTATPALIWVKDPSQFSHQKQYSLRLETREVLIPLIKGLKEQGLLIECYSPYKTPILGIRKGPDKWRLVQNLWLVNETVGPLHMCFQTLILSWLRNYPTPPAIWF